MKAQGFLAYAFLLPVLGNSIAHSLAAGWERDPGVDRRVERLIQQLGSDEFREREEASRALIRIGGPALDPLRRTLQDPDPERAIRAKRCLQEIEDNMTPYDYVIDLKSFSKLAQLRAYEKLLELGPRGKPIVPALIQALDDPDPGMQQTAIAILGGLGSNAIEAVPHILQVLRNENKGGQVRATAAIWLSSFGVAAESAVPELLRQATNQDRHIRRGVACALRHLGTTHAETIPTLLRLLRDHDAEVAGGAARSLGILGREAEQCVPALCELLRKAPGLPGEIRSIIGVTPACQYVEECCILALADYKGRAKSALPLLREIAKNPKTPLGHQVSAERAIDAIERNIGH